MSFRFGDDVIKFYWWRHQNQWFRKVHGKISITSWVFVVRSWLTPRIKASKFLYQNKLHLESNYASVGNYSSNIPGNNGKNALWRHNDVTWRHVVGFSRKFQGKLFLGIWWHCENLESNRWSKRKLGFPLNYRNNAWHFTSCWLIPCNFRSTNAMTLKISEKASNR